MSLNFVLHIKISCWINHATYIDIETLTPHLVVDLSEHFVSIHVAKTRHLLNTRNPHANMHQASTPICS